MCYLFQLSALKKAQLELENIVTLFKTIYVKKSLVRV